MLTPKEDVDRGASLFFVAGSLLLLLGMAAIAVDISAVFNERRLTQTAADVAVMAGAVEAAYFPADSADVSEQAIAVARLNTRNTFGDSTDPVDPIWIELWRSCVDPDRPLNFFPLPEPDGWSAVITATPSTGTLDCVSRSASLLRLRMPDQLVDSAFGGILGASTLRTDAVAVARLAPEVTTAPIIPYGLSGNAGVGESCIGTGPPGTAYAPCSGPSAGTFGTLLSEFFGEFYGTADCGNPGADEIATESAIGLDHFVSPWPNDGSVSMGDPHPGDTDVLALPLTNRDACTESGGVAIPEDDFPINTVRVDSGFPSNEMERGLVSDEEFFGQPSRLQQEGEHLVGVTLNPNETRNVVRRRGGIHDDVWQLDNHGPWDYLLGSAAGVSSNCDPGAYTSSLDEFEKASLFSMCLSDYESTNATAVIFNDFLDHSPRFVWAPQYWYELPDTGISWSPVAEYRTMFIAGLWFNCVSGSCGVIFYPDQHQTSELCDGGGTNCATLSLDQFSAWILPDSAVPPQIRNAIPGGQTPFQPLLWN